MHKQHEGSARPSTSQAKTKGLRAWGSEIAQARKKKGCLKVHEERKKRKEKQGQPLVLHITQLGKGSGKGKVCRNWGGV